MPGSPLPSRHGGTQCPRLSLTPQIAQCVSRNSFPHPNITWHKNGEKLQPEDKSELDVDGGGHEELHLPAGRGAGALVLSRALLAGDWQPVATHRSPVLPREPSSALVASLRAGNSVCVPCSGEDPNHSDSRVKWAVHSEQHPLRPRHPGGPQLPVLLHRALLAAGTDPHRGVTASQRHCFL